MPSVLLTRPENRSGGDQPINRLLKQGGIQVLELPMLRFGLPRDIDALDNALRGMAAGEYDYTILTSPTAVDFFEERVQELGLSKDGLSAVQFGTVGHTTEERLRELGYQTALPVPQVAGWMNFVQALDPAMIRGKRVLLLQSQMGLEELDHAFSEMGAKTERVVLYVTKGPSLGDSARLISLLESQRPDVIAFFSPSSVAFFVTAVAEMGTGHLHNLPAIACIGETTAREVEERLRRRPEIVARKADQESLAKDILIYLQSKNLTLN